MQKIAIRAAAGLGDALLMLIASETLRKQGNEVTTFTPHHIHLKPLFPEHHFAPYGPIDHSYDRLILQNDNTKLHLVKTDRERLSIFYPTYQANRHPPLAPQDVRFNEDETMVKNIMRAVSTQNKDNGLKLPQGLIFKKYPKRLVIHPTSADPSHIYPREKFLQLARKKKKQGYDIHFIVAPHEFVAWKELSYPVHAMPLVELGAFLHESGELIGNESGPAHLASNVGIPTTMIGSCAKRLKLWRPDFTPGVVITPPEWIPNFKGCRLRSNYWTSFIFFP
jgi:heptosyltransferase-3